MTIYLTAEQILFSHYRLVSETGGNIVFVILDCLNKPLHGQNRHLITRNFTKISSKKQHAVMESLVNKHPFKVYHSCSRL